MALWELLTQTMYSLNKIQFQVAVNGAVEGGGVLLDILEPTAQEGKLFLEKAW